jgi:hypothetical protein
MPIVIMPSVVAPNLYLQRFFFIETKIININFTYLSMSVGQLSFDQMSVGQKGAELAE